MELVCLIDVILILASALVATQIFDQQIVSINEKCAAHLQLAMNQVCINWSHR